MAFREQTRTDENFLDISRTRSLHYTILTRTFNSGFPFQRKKFGQQRSDAAREMLAMKAKSLSGLCAPGLSCYPCVLASQQTQQKI